MVGVSGYGVIAVVKLPGNGIFHVCCARHYCFSGTDACPLHRLSVAGGPLSCLPISLFPHLDHSLMLDHVFAEAERIRQRGSQSQMGHIFNDAEFKELYAHVVAPFKQEHGRQFDAAIEGHGLAQQKIEAYIKKNITAMRKFHRKILELQQEVHRERHLILTASSAQGSFAHVIPPPSILSAYAELESTQLDQRPLSLVLWTRDHIPINIVNECS